MPSKSENQAKVDAKASEAAQRLEGVKVKLAEVRQVMSDARSKRDQSINDAEKAYSEAYGTGRTDQQNELAELDQAYSVLREDIVSRWRNEHSALTEARDAAVAAATDEYDETQEASKFVFGGDQG